jgi:hypothetical protein
MKFITTLTILIFSKFLFSQELGDYDLEPYNDGVNFKVLDQNDAIEKNESLEALIIIFKSPNYQNARISISNNPQLKEIKLIGSNQELINFISESNLPNLTHLFIKRYESIELEIPSFPKLENLEIQSNYVKNLKMENANLDKLNILSIDAPKLKDWTTDKFFPKLGLIELKAPLLENFPIENMPEINQFSYYCSFKQMPLNLCSYDELKFISFENYFPFKVEECFNEKIRKGIFSNLTIYDKIDGKVITELLSKDRKNKK